MNCKAEELNVTPSELKKQISKWAKVDSSFAGFTYLGKHRPTITLDEFIEIQDRIESNPLGSGNRHKGIG